MAARFWVTGGTGNWNSTTNWSATTGGASGASVPSTSDTATYDASSGAGTATLDISPDVQTLTMTGFTGTLAFGTNTISLNSTNVIFTGATTMTVTGTPQIICTNSSATTRTISPTAVTEANSISFRITAGTGTLGLSSGAYRDLDFTDGINPTGFAGNITSTANTIYGNFKASTSGMTRTAGTGTYTFAATSGTKTINTAGVTFDNPFTFNGVGGTFQLQDALTSGATHTCTLTNGTLDLVSYTLTTGAFSSNNSNTRVLAFGTGKIVLTGNTATIWTNATGTGFTYTGTSRIEALGPATTGQRLLTPSTTATSTEATALNFYITGGSDTVNFSATSRRVNILDFTGFTGTFTNSNLTVHGNYTLAASPMVVGSGTEITTFATTTSQNITTNAQTLDFPITLNGIGGTFAMQDALTLGSTRALTMTNGTLQLKSGTTNTVGSFVTTGTTQKFLSATTPGSQATLSDASGTNSVSYLTIQDSAATGGAVFQSYLSNLNVNSGNNTGWNFGNVIAGNVITETATGTDTVASIATFFNSLQETATGTDAINGRPFWDVINNTQTANWSAVSTT